MPSIALTHRWRPRLLPHKQAVQASHASKSCKHTWLTRSSDTQPAPSSTSSVRLVSRVRAGVRADSRMLHWLMSRLCKEGIGR